MLTPDRQKILELIKLNELNKNFNVDVEDDPEPIKLNPDDVDYLRTKLSSKIKTKIANILATNFYEKKIKNKEFEIKQVIGLENFNTIKNQDVAYVLSENFTAEIKAFAERFDGRIKTIPADDIYFYLKEML